MAQIDRAPRQVGEIDHRRADPIPTARVLQRNVVVARRKLNSSRLVPCASADRPGAHTANGADPALPPASTATVAARGSSK